MLRKPLILTLCALVASIFSAGRTDGSIFHLNAIYLDGTGSMTGSFEYDAGTYSNWNLTGGGSSTYPYGTYVNYTTANSTIDPLHPFGFFPITSDGTGFALMNTSAPPYVYSFLWLGFDASLDTLNPGDNVSLTPFGGAFSHSQEIRNDGTLQYYNGFSSGTVMREEDGPAIPEPTTALALGLGLIGLALSARVRRRR